MTSAPATVSITVDGPPAGGPTAVADNWPVTGQDYASAGYAYVPGPCTDPTTNDTSPQHYPLTVINVTQPHLPNSNSFISGNTVCYSMTYSGSNYPPNTDSFTYEISDGHGGVAWGTVYVTITWVQN
jgi:hypothetical protein